MRRADLCASAARCAASSCHRAARRCAFAASTVAPATGISAERSHPLAEEGQHPQTGSAAQPHPPGPPPRPEPRRLTGTPPHAAASHAARSPQPRSAGNAQQTVCKPFPDARPESGQPAIPARRLVTQPPSFQTTGHRRRVCHRAGDCASLPVPVAVHDSGWLARCNPGGSNDTAQ